MGTLGSNILSGRRRGPDASMPKNPDEIEAKIRNRLNIDEAGSLTVSGLRSVILPVRTLADLSAAGERIIGSGMAGVLFLAGGQGGGGGGGGGPGGPRPAAGPAAPPR